MEGSVLREIITNTMYGGINIMKLRIILIITIVILITSTPIYASTSISMELKQDEKYTSLDFNGDGKKDTFSYTYYRDGAGYAEFTLNGHKQKVEVARGTQINYYKYSKTQIYLFIYMHLYGGGELHVYRYDGNKLKKANGNIGIMGSSYFDHADGKYVYVESRPYHQDHISSFKNYDYNNELTTFLFKYKLNEKKKKFVLATKYGTPVKKYNMTYKGKTFKTSDSAKSNNTKGLTLKNGMKVKLTKIYIIPETNSYGYKYYRYRFRVDCNGKYGWFDNSMDRPFE